jgi:hypothetical protein
MNIHIQQQAMQLINMQQVQNPHTSTNLDIGLYPIFHFTFANKPFNTQQHRRIQLGTPIISLPQRQIAYFSKTLHKHHVHPGQRCQF